MSCLFLYNKYHVQDLILNVNILLHFYFTYCFFYYIHLSRLSYQIALTDDYLAGIAGYPVTSVGHASAITENDDSFDLEALDIATTPTSKSHHHRQLNLQFKMNISSDDSLPDNVIDSFDMCDDATGDKQGRSSSIGSETGHSSLCDGFDYTLKLAEEMDDVRVYHYLRVSQSVDQTSGQSTVEITEV